MSLYKRKSDVRFRVVGDEGVVVRQQAAEVLAVNDVGARIVGLLETDRDLAEVVTALAAEYDVATEELTRDVEGFVTDLVAAGVIEEVP